MDKPTMKNKSQGLQESHSLTQMVTPVCYTTKNLNAHMAARSPLKRTLYKLATLVNFKKEE